jgi:hypothetical protein
MLKPPITENSVHTETPVICRTVKPITLKDGRNLALVIPFLYG